MNNDDIKARIDGAPGVFIGFIAFRPKPAPTGEGERCEFRYFSRIYESMRQHIKKILTDADLTGVYVPREPICAFAIGALLVEEVKPKHYENVFKYLDFLKTYEALWIVKHLITKDPYVQGTTHFVKWAKANVHELTK